MSDVATTNIGNWVEDQNFLEAEDKTTAPDVERPVTLEDLVRVGPGTLNGRFLRRFWHPVISAQVLQPGRALPLKRLGEDFTLYRGEGGAFHAAAFRCAHRGTQLSTGWVEDDCIRCLYHGWKYDETGQCVEQPDENERFKSKIKIRTYPTQEYIGLVYVYFGEDDPPPLPRYPSFEDPNAVLNTNNIVPNVLPYSYWNGQENDAFHVDWAHRDGPYGFAVAGRNGHVSVSCEETEYGFSETEIRSGATHDSVSMKHHIVPNIRLRWARITGAYHSAEEGGQYSEAMRYSVPVDDSHFVVVGVQADHNLTSEEKELGRKRRVRPEGLTVPELGEGVLAGKWSLYDFPGMIENDPRIFGAQDYVTQRGQGVAGMLQDEHLGRTDVQCAMWRRIYRRELTALAKGEPLTNWVVPEHLPVLISDTEHDG